MTKKRILIKSNSIHALYSDFESQWEDVWLVFKHGRRPVHLAPTVNASNLIAYEIKGAIDNIEKYERELAAGRAKTTTSIVSDPAPEDVFEIDNAAMLEHYRRELAWWRGIDARLAAGESLVVKDADNDGCPDLFIRAKALTRAKIEEALDLYLRRKGYLKPGSAPKFEWKKPRLICRSWPE